MNILDLMSSRSQEHDRFGSMILKPTQKELESIHGLIKVFTNLATIDYIPDRYLRYLSELLGYRYLETEDPDVQREILKRLVKEYHNKGLLETLQKIANRGYSSNFFLGDLTYYNGKIEEGYSSITYPRDFLFRYDYSKWDSSHRWPDLKEWRDGVIQIAMSTSDPSDRVLKLIDENLPAGIKYYMSTLRDISGDIGYLDMIFKVLDDTHQAEILYDLGILEPYYNAVDFFRYDYSEWDSKKWIIRETVSTETCEESKPWAAIYNVFYPLDTGYQVEEVYDEPFMYNWNRFNGIIGGTDDTEILDIPIVLFKQKSEPYDQNIENDKDVTMEVGASTEVIQED